MAAADSHQVKICTGVAAPMLAGPPLWSCMPSSLSHLTKGVHLRVSVSSSLQQPEPFTTFLSYGSIFSLHFLNARDLYNPEACLPVFSPGNLNQI